MPISRYKNFGTIKDPKNGKMRLRTFPPVSSREVRRQNDITVRLQGAMRIDKIAEEYLGDGRYWWIICLLNDFTFPFGKMVAEGTLIRVPASIDNFVNIIQDKIR